VMKDGSSLVGTRCARPWTSVSCPYHGTPEFSFALYWACHTGRMKSAFVMLLCAVSVSAAPKGWPKEIQEINYLSKADNTKQPALFYAPAVRGEPRPLLVGLHTWSSDYRQNNSPYGKWCIEKKWNFIHPNFRGPNRRPQATGSELVVKDILSAVEFAKKNGAVDETRIYLVGASGGGYAALLMAGRAPEIWAGVSAWVPILDLAEWHAQTSKRNLKYAREIENSIGGKPTPGSKAAAEAMKRSPVTYLAHAKGVALDINAGINDGHKGSVPISHTLEAFNLLAAEKDRLSAKQISEFTRMAKVPASLEYSLPTDKTYGPKRVLFRRHSGAARVTIFQGGHEIIPPAALQWLAKQQRMRAPKNE
jgi:poly(3-hydroxybutyrate) depolymerase